MAGVEVEKVLKGGKRGQKVSESSESFSVIPSLQGPEGFLGLCGPHQPVQPFSTWWGSCLSREPEEGALELQGEQKGIIVARMRARQSATSLLGVQANAGVRPEVERCQVDITYSRGSSVRVPPINTRDGCQWHLSGRTSIIAALSNHILLLWQQYDSVIKESGC